ncbi:hypothetical protein A33M_0477 [Rhodovulum sp. PH10]|nr:hypothetical protein A33M_0477 [Rhodovulum sp. PH10]
MCDMDSSDPNLTRKPFCSVCGARMRYARSIPRLGANPELVSYECQRCGHVVTRAEDEPS